MIKSFTRLILRVRISIRPVRRQIKNLVVWLFKSKETTNFTFNLSENNLRHLASIVAHVTKVNYDTALLYADKLIHDDELRQHVVAATKNSNLTHMADTEVRYARRIGWYSIARAIKPKVIVETGVDKGLGSCVLTAALMKNSQEGHEGYYYGTDINPKSGYLLSGKYAKYGAILYGDSINSLNNLNEKIDLFINDSDHSASYEAKEYEVVKPKLSANAVILGDNAHVTDKLLEFSKREGRSFLYSQENPVDYWYPGAGIGISFKS